MTRRLTMAAVGGALIAFVIATLAPLASAETPYNFKVKCKGAWTVQLQWTENGVPIPPGEPPLACIDGAPINITVNKPANANDVEVDVELVEQPPAVLSARCHFDKNFPVTQLGKLQGQCQVQGGSEVVPKGTRKLKVQMKPLPN